MKLHTKLSTAQDVFGNPSSSFSTGFNIRVAGGIHQDCFQYPHEWQDSDRHSGWETAGKLISDGKIYFTHNFHKSHGGCEVGHAFRYGGTWVCNVCGNSQLNQPWWNIKVYKDGNAFCCVGEGFSNLQESENFAFGDTLGKAILNYGDLQLKKATP